MAFSNDNRTCMWILQDAITRKWPNGATWLIVKWLMKRYRPSDLMTEVELHKKLASFKMAENDNQANLFTQSAEIRTWYTKDLVTSTDASITRAYKLLVTPFAITRSQGRAFDIDELEESLIALWRAFTSTGTATLSKEISEMGLGSVPFAGTCYKCKQKGHKANASPQNSNKKKFDNKYNLCGRQGHKKVDCFEDDKNASKRLKTRKAKS